MHHVIPSLSAASDLACFRPPPSCRCCAASASCLRPRLYATAVHAMQIGTAAAAHPDAPAHDCTTEHAGGITNTCMRLAQTCP